MESINILKGYDKIDSNLENQNYLSKPTRKPLLIILIVSAILLLTLTIALGFAALVHESNTEPPEPDSLYGNSAVSIKTVCNVTLYASSCFSSISSLNVSIQPDPESIFKLSLRVSIQQLHNVSTLFTSLNDVNSRAAIDDCLNLFGDALNRLNDSLSAMEVDHGEKALTFKKMNDIQTWVSGAMTDQQTCVDGLEEMGSTILDQVKATMVKCNEFLSNSLAIIANMQNLLDKFDLKLH